MKRPVASSWMSARFIFLLKSRSEVSRELDVAEASLLQAASDESILASEQFVTHQHRDEVDGRVFLRLRLAETGLEDVGHAGEAKFPKGVIEFDEIHVGSPVWRSIRSR